MIIQSNEGVERLRNFLIGLQNDIYSGKQDYFIFKKDNGDYFFVTDACNEFYHVAIGTLTADGKGDGSGQLYSIMKNARHFMDNVEYDPVERLCNMVKDMEFMGVVRDERVLIDSKSVTSYNRVRPTCEWAYALKKYQESVKNKEYWYRAHLKHKDGTVLAVIGDKDKKRFDEEIAKIEQDIAAYVADIGTYKAEDLHLEILPPHRIRSKTKQETQER